MNEELNPKPVPENSRGGGDPLSTALEDLLHGRFAGKGIPLADSGLPPSAANSPSGSRDAQTAVPAYPSCPRPEEWTLLLAEGPSLAEMGKVNELLAHAAICRACTESLRALSAELSPEETALLSELSAATEAGQRALAAKLAGTPHKSPVSSLPAPVLPALKVVPRSVRRKAIWIGAALAASLLIVAGLGLWWRAANNPQRLLAEEYSHDRIFDLRMPGAAFGEVTPMTHLRGGTASREPAQLKEARRRIDRELEEAPDDAELLELEARADILEEKFDPAIEILERLVAAGPITASLLLDDASAYFERGMATGSDSDRNIALDYLRRADELAPGDTVILFNEAIAMEDRGQFMNAVETWNRYLRFERDPRWQADGSRHLQDLEQKLNQLKPH